MSEQEAEDADMEDQANTELDEQEPPTHDSGKKYEVCPICEGEGKYVNPNIDSQGLTQEDFDEDPDMRENYFGGMYDVTCKCCRGNRVVTASELAEYEDRLQDHKTMMAENGEFYGDSRI